MYVTRACKHASKIGGLNRGSQAFSTTSALCSLIARTMSAMLDASADPERKRELSKPAIEAVDRCSSMSTSVIESKKLRSAAIAATLDPTPPAPTTKIFITKPQYSYLTTP